jgi:diaminohydroxyphosphoribosylaminopyrimidine deaminase / 5-amino-6-(5-phosphoribosylamino)uracil reductase
MSLGGADDTRFLAMSARLALRGHGGAEPNPLVGCVIVQPRDQRIVGWGYHRQCGGPHAEIVALRRAGAHARGATLYCTLEPCNHTGRTPPCTNSILKAGVKRVVFAHRDPHVVASGGMECLRAGGIDVELNEQCMPAMAVSDPFVHCIRTGLPWVIAKWAQTLDGKIATRPAHDSKWISNQASRKMVHRERGRVDAILTGIGTVLQDDPLLTARDVRTRRVAKRIVIDPRLETPPDSQLVRTAREYPTIVVCDAFTLSARNDVARRLRENSIQIVDFHCESGEIPLGDVLRNLLQRFEISTILVEAGPRLLTRLFQQQLINEAWIFIAPLLTGDEQALGLNLTNGASMRLESLQRRSGDLIARYRVT